MGKSTGVNSQSGLGNTDSNTENELPVVPQGKSKGSRTSSVSSSSDVVFVDTLHSGDDRRLTSPSRVTRSSERSVSRDGSTGTVSSGHLETPMKGNLSPTALNITF